MKTGTRSREPNPYADSNNNTNDIAIATMIASDNHNTSYTMARAIATTAPAIAAEIARTGASASGKSDTPDTSKRSVVHHPLRRSMSLLQPAPPALLALILRSAERRYATHCRSEDTVYDPV